MFFYYYKFIYEKWCYCFIVFVVLYVDVMLVYYVMFFFLCGGGMCYKFWDCIRGYCYNCNSVNIFDVIIMFEFM